MILILCGISVPQNARCLPRTCGINCSRFALLSALITAYASDDFYQISLAPHVVYEFLQFRLHIATGKKRAIYAVIVSYIYLPKLYCLLCEKSSLNVRLAAIHSINNAYLWKVRKLLIVFYSQPMPIMTNICSTIRIYR